MLGALVTTTKPRDHGIFGTGAAFSFAIAFFGFLARPVASVFGLDPQTLALAAENIRWLSVFNLAFAAMFVLSAALRASGDAWSPLWISGGVNLLNLPLLFVFIFGFWGVPAMGVGAAIAAGISLASDPPCC